VNNGLIAVTLLMFLLTTVHIAIIIWSADPVYVIEGATAPYKIQNIPITLHILNVSRTVYTALTYNHHLLVLCGRRNRIVAGMGVVGEDMEVSCSPIDPVAGSGR
jgi:hypothetical protein